MSPHTKPTQSANLLAYLRSHPKGITDLEALMSLRIRRLSARIFELSQQGYTFEREWFTTEGGARVMRYSLAQPVQLALSI